MNEQQKNNINQQNSRPDQEQLADTITLNELRDDPQKLNEVVWQVIKGSERRLKSLTISTPSDNYSDPVAIEWGGRGLEGTVLYIPAPLAWRVLLKGVEIGMRLANEEQHNETDRDDIQRV